MLAIQIGLVGAGRMATALARGFIEAKVVPATAIRASDPYPAARESFARDVPGVRVSENNIEVVKNADLVLIAVKPQQMSDVLAGVRNTIPPNALVVSIAAGVTLDRLAASLPP